MTTKSTAKTSTADRVKLTQLLQTVSGHPRVTKCRTCGKDCGTTALVKLVYTFEPCGCEFAPYSHLVENIYHRDCWTKNGVSSGADSE